MNLTLPYIDRIWRAEGEIALDPPLAAEEAFARLDPLFQTPGTTYAVDGDTLTYSKHNPAAPSQPPQVYLADTSGKRIAWVEENKLDASHPYAAFLPAHRAPTFGTIKAVDGTVLHWRMITPVMEPGKRSLIAVAVRPGNGK